jgi:hypothetical protein
VRSAYRTPLYTVQVGDAVYWWAKKPGQPARQVHGTVVALDPWYARVRLFAVDGMIRVRTVARKRLTPVQTSAPAGK